MKRRLALVLLSVLLLAACATRMMTPGHDDEEGFDPRKVPTPNPAITNVFVVNGQIVVDQEPIRAPRVEQPSLRWRLDQSSDHRFADPGGIEIIDLKANCQAAGKQGKVYVCTYKRADAKPQHKYRIKVMRLNQPPVELDPTIMND